MMREFLLMDSRGEPIAEGEQEGDTYRIFSPHGDTLEFESLSDVFKFCGDVRIQYRLFAMPDQPRQLSLLGGAPDERHKTSE